MQERKATVAVIGKGGRESAMAEAYAASPHVEKVLVIPGNDMVGRVSEKPIIPVKNIAATDIKNISNIVADEKVTLVDIGEDMAIEAGLADRLRDMNIATVGPSRDAGRLEWDKVYGRQIAKTMGIAQPEFHVFRNLAPAREFLRRGGDRLVFVKASGLAEGKGVKSARNTREALAAIRQLSIDYHQAMNVFLIEEGAVGEEFSAFYAVSGQDYKHLGDAQDHKRVFDNDLGENTGGMGAYSHPSITKDAVLREGHEEIVRKTVAAEIEMEEPYQGILFVGGMKTKQVPHGLLIEYNARWGDPEAQAIIPGLKTDFFELGMAIAQGTLNEIEVKSDDMVRVAVTLATKGYPGDNRQALNKEIRGIDRATNVDDVSIYGAAVKTEDDRFYTDGGRLLYVVGKGHNLKSARDKAYAALEEISIAGDNGHYRTDIGRRDLARNPQ